MARIAVLGNKLAGVKSGAHLTHLEIARALAARGHAVEYASISGGTKTRLGDPIQRGPLHVMRATERADVVLVRDEQSVRAVLARCANRPVLYTCHSPAGDPRTLGLNLSKSSTVVWVSDALRSQCAEYSGASVVIEGCPIDPAMVRTKPGERVTLVNLSLRKGGELFWRLVEAMPDTKFLGVFSWGDQIIPAKVPGNAIVLASQSDPRVFYRQTRVLLQPSAESGTVRVGKLPAWGEAWSRVGVEAAMSGIPSIASPVAGIRASLGDAATYIDRDDFEGWVQAIRQHQDPTHWAERSRIALLKGEQAIRRLSGIVDEYEALVERAVRRLAA